MKGKTINNCTTDVGLIIMNIKDNKRKKESQTKIEKEFLKLIQTKELNEIKVTDIVKNAHVNRSTFYANYIDIYDLADKIKEEMFYNFLNLYQEEVKIEKHSYNYLKMFEHIKENQIYYRTLFKLNFDFTDYYDLNHEEEQMLKFYGNTKNMEYHMAYFKAGMNAIIRKWLFNGCVESPEDMKEILDSEYQNKIREV